MKRCCSCKESLSTEMFGKLKASKDGLAHRCKPCDRLATKHWRETHREEHRAMSLAWNKANPKRVKENSSRFNKENRARRTAQERNRVAMKKQATPAWADFEEIYYIYELAKERSLEVDHIVPLNSDVVCGLHVQDNLRCIPKTLNLKKLNRYWPDMAVEGLGG